MLECKKTNSLQQVRLHGTAKKKLSSYWMKIENSGTFGQYGGPVKGSNEIILE